MSASYWSLDGVIDALVAGLRARSGLAGKQVEDSWPGELQKHESIWIDDASSDEHVAGMRDGPIKNVENYSLFVLCDVFAEGGSAKDARDRLTPLVGEVMRFVAEQKRLQIDTTEYVTIRVAGWKVRPYAMAEGRGVAARIEIKVLGRR